MSEKANSASAKIGPGDKVAVYRLEEQIGQGGMAVVYRAHDERLDRQVALKVLAPDLAADPGFRARFTRESRAAAAVDHRHILPVYDTGDDDGVLFIAMRYVAGGDVRTLFSGDQGLAPARVWNIVSQVADALDVAHGHSLIHRDVKPANVLIDVAARSTSGRIDHVYLTDFGISTQGVVSHLTSTGHFVGSLAYISPEQIEAGTIRGQADQYSLACTTYELLTGEPPFDGDNAVMLMNAQLTLPPPPASAKRPGLAPAVDLVLAEALAKSPEQRYPTCADFADELGKALGLAAGTPSVVSDSQATVSSGYSAQLIVPTPTEVTDPALLPATTGPGQVPPVVRPAPWPPAPMPPWMPVPVTAPPPRKDRGLLVAALVAVVVVALAAAGTVAFVATRSTAQLVSAPTSAPATTIAPPPPTPIPTPTQTEATEVKAINVLLESSGGSRQQLSTAVSDVADCLNVGYDVTQLEQIVTERESQLSEAQGLSVDAIPDGSVLQSDLVTALTASLKADQDYLAWAQEQNGNDCENGTYSQHYQAALSDDTTATDDKATFVQAWTPPAEQYGYSTNPYF